MRHLAKDIAKTLGQPDAPLLQAIRAQKIRPYIFEEADTEKEIDMRCPILCVKPDAPHFCQPCNQAVLWSAGCRRCAEHAYATPVPYPGIPVLTPLEKGGLDEALYTSEDGTVYNAEFVAVGAYDHDTKDLYLFHVDSPDVP